MTTRSAGLICGALSIALVSPAQTPTRINPGQIGPIIPSATTIVIPSAFGQYAGSPWFGVTGNITVTAMSGAFIGQQGTLTTINGPLTFSAGASIAASCTTTAGSTYAWYFDGGQFWVMGPGCTSIPSTFPGGFITPALFGARCGASDSTAAIQAMFNSIPVTSGLKIEIPCQFTVSNIYIPSSAIGLVVEGSATQDTVFPASGALAGFIAKSGTAGTLLSIYSLQVTMRDLVVNCANICAVPIDSVANQNGTMDNVSAIGGTGDGMQMNTEGGPATVLTSAITASSMATFTVQGTALPGFPLRGVSPCAALTVNNGMTTQESFAYTISGNTLTPSSPPVHSHSIGEPVTCHGSNNNLLMLHPSFKFNGGNGLNMFNSGDNNAVTQIAPISFGNGGVGELLCCFIGKIYGGDMEANAQVLQLGDTGGDGALPTGRTTFEWDINLEDYESGSGAVIPVCDFDSHIHFYNAAQLLFKPAGVGNYCPTYDSVGTDTIGEGVDQGSGNIPQYTWKTPFTKCILSISAARSLLCYDPTGTQVPADLYTKTNSTTDKNAVYQPQNYQNVVTGTASALAITLTDTAGNNIPLNLGTDGVPIAIKLSAILASGTGNTLSVNGGSALTLANACNPATFSVSHTFQVGTVVTIIFLNTFGYFAVTTGGC